MVQHLRASITSQKLNVHMVFAGYMAAIGPGADSHLSKSAARKQTSVSAYNHHGTTHSWQCSTRSHRMTAFGLETQFRFSTPHSC
jgi:hypothetical protein